MPSQAQACTKSCKCASGASGDGGKDVNTQKYCEYFCSNNGFCGDGEIYKSGTDCTSCKGKNLSKMIFNDLVDNICDKILNLIQVNIYVS